MPYCLILIRDASMISSVMQHLMAQAAEPVALISQAWIWGYFWGHFRRFLRRWKKQWQKKWSCTGCKCPSQCKNFF